MTSRPHILRAIFVSAPLFLAFAGLSWRLYDLAHRQDLVQEARRQHEDSIVLPAMRGPIVDRNRNVLAQSVKVHTVIADPRFIREEDERLSKDGKTPKRDILVKLLANSLATPETEIAEKLDGTGRYAVLKRKVSEEIAGQLKESFQSQRIRGISFEDDQMRFYPNGSLMSHILGFVDSDQRGKDGVEFLMQSDLQGQDGWRKIERDARRKEIVVFRNEDFPPRHGYTVVLTLDQVLQNIVEQELDASIAEYHPDSAVAMVVRPTTGEILALANRPTYDPNSCSKSIDALRNRAVADLNEPGSTFKIVAVASALDQRIVSLSDTIFCENGRFKYAGRYLSDHEPYANLNVTGILVRSSNIGAAKIALRMGDEKMYRAIKSFGFGEKAFANDGPERWPGEIRGIVHPLKNWSKVSITRLAMGHEVGVTPIQMVNAMCAIANGGNLMRPLVIKQVLDEHGNTVREFFPKVTRRVVDRRTARDLTSALVQVVSKEGTAARAAIPGFLVAGKTGTAQKLIDGQYVHDQFVSSFGGYFPAFDPKVCIYIMFDNPKGKDRYAGAVAAPVFRNMAIRIASYLRLKPDQDIASEGSTPITIQAAYQGGEH